MHPSHLTEAEVERLFAAAKANRLLWVELQEDVVRAQEERDRLVQQPNVDQQQRHAPDGSTATRPRLRRTRLELTPVAQNERHDARLRQDVAACLPGAIGSARMEELRSHPTAKPVALVADAMRDCTRRGDVVLDTFSGSGTTIMAAERIGRRAPQRRRPCALVPRASNDRALLNLAGPATKPTWAGSSGRAIMLDLNVVLRRTAAAASAIAFAVATVIFGVIPASSEVVTLRMHTFVPPVSSSYKSLRTWADRVEKHSKGQLKIQLFGVMQLGGKAPDLYDQVENGVVDIAWMLPGYKAGLFPAISVFELPFMAGRAPVVSPAVDDYARSVGAKEWSEIHPIVFHYAGASVLYLKDKRVTKMEDFKGLRFRTPSRESTGALQAMGAISVPVPGVATMAEIMIHGVVNGVITPWYRTCDQGHRCRDLPCGNEHARTDPGYDDEHD